MKTCKQRHREPGFSLLARLLQKDVRTLHRWITKRPQLRCVLRVKPHGKQWRIDWPLSYRELKDWLAQVTEAVAPFTRIPDRTARSRLAKKFSDDLGFGDEQRERDVEILRHAMLLKYASRKLRTPKEDTEEQAKDNSPQPAEWESELDYYSSTARIVSAQFKCRVEDAPRYWRKFCHRFSQKIQTLNAPAVDWLRKNGIYEQAMRLLPTGSGDLIALIGGPRAGGEPRVKLYRFAPRWKSNNAAHWRKGYFLTKYLQLLPLASATETESECSRMLELWPDSHHLERAKEHYEKEWQLKTLSEVAFKLLGEGKSVTGNTLAPLLFRNPRAQDAWKSHQQQLESIPQGIQVFCDEKTDKRGISLREFRLRYNKQDIAFAKNAAERAQNGSSEVADNKNVIYGEPKQGEECKQSKDESGVSELDANGKPITDSKEMEKHFVSPHVASRVRRQIEESHADIQALTPEERQKLETALGRSVKDYMKKPFKDDI